jgi:hypothetical protein
MNGFKGDTLKQVVQGIPDPALFSFVTVFRNGIPEKKALGSCRNKLDLGLIRSS